MNKNSFIDRLNLYLDEELTPVESEELLVEIRENPEYQRIYIEYRKLFGACSQLGETFAERRQISPWRQKVYVYGGMAAAVALLLLAARNLSPILEGLQGEVALQPIVSSNVNEVVSAPLLTVDVRESDGRALPAGQAKTSLSFDLEKAFVQDGVSHDFGTDSSVKFARFSGGGAEKIESGWSEGTFAFGEDVQQANSVEEPATESAGSEPVFTVRSMGSAFDQSGEGVRFDLGRAAAAVSVSNP